MAKSEYLPFATADGANVISDDEYQNLTTRHNGFVAGVARSDVMNTVWRQSSVMSSALGQFIADRTGKDVLDDGDVAALLTSLQDALKSQISDTVPAASTSVAGITKLSSATNSNDETMAATPKAIKAAYDLANKVSVDGIYPVGIVTWFAQNKDPNTLFPGTTWKYIGENRTVRLASANGSDVMTTGGADSVTLTAENLPAHAHTFSANTSTFDYGTKQTDVQGEHTHPFNGPDYSHGNGADGGNFRLDAPLNTGAAGSHAHNVPIGAHAHSVSGTTANTGSGTAFSVANAFIKLMGWYRSA
ncbi:Phage tail fibre repeat-containing protein [Izhakiella capsodis]|uniref:Phage tail fibre repeat-containing protein n=1 Tax=Izhakiella capsodis TaxID=1367852 RepID=A0A1I4ZD22_9GAMM|nr:tail fiber protein [Izhakiella capsodis]SFN48087.1 Phage tail fibre repeat-containing protein [Izhakiella capsodis]